MANILSSRAVLVELTIHNWKGQTIDREVSEKVANDLNANKNAGKYTKYLINPEAYKGMQKASSSARTDHYKHTLPWSDSGQRLLPISFYNKYREDIDRHIEAFLEARNTFFRDYEKHIEQAEEDLGDMFDRSEYPSVNTLRQKMSIEYSFTTIPDTNHIILSLAEDEVERVKSDVEASMNNKTENAVNGIIDRVKDVVETVRDRLTEDENGDAKTFRNSMLNNVKDLVEDLPNLNVTKDPDIERLTSDLQEAVADVEPDELRPDNKNFKPEKREALSKNMDDVMSGYFGEGA